MYSEKKMCTDGLHNLNPPCIHPRLEERNAELYDYWCPNATKSLENATFSRLFAVKVKSFPFSFPWLYVNSWGRAKISEAPTQS